VASATVVERMPSLSSWFWAKNRLDSSVSSRREELASAVWVKVGE